jgi:hypothetical protein
LFAAARGQWTRAAFPVKSNVAQFFRQLFVQFAQQDFPGTSELVVKLLTTY